MTDTAGAPVVHLHIGTMKSGTSYVQNILEQQQALLADLGVLYPGNTGPAVNDVLGRRRTPGQGPTANAWATLVAAVRAWTGPSVVVSMEFLGLASRTQVEQIVQSLRPSRVRVVLTARDIARTVPSAWQQTTKNRGTTTWPDFVASVMAASGATTETDAAGQFWRHHDVVDIARRWADVVGAAQVTVVTVPPPGSPPELLWERFALATGLDAHQVRAMGAERNPSLGLTEAELLRRLNDRLGGGLNPAAYRRLVTGVMSRRMLRTPAAQTRVPPLPRVAIEWVHEHGDTVRHELDALGVAVVGELAELVPPLDDRRAEQSGTRSGEQSAQADAAAVPDSDLAATAVTAAAALLVEIAEVQAHRGPR